MPSPGWRPGARVRSRAPGIASAVALAIASAVPGACGPSGPAAASGAQESAARSLTVAAVDFDGLVKLLASGGARTTVVNCWATWCAPCVAELPDLLAAAAAQRDRDVRVVLVSYDLLVPDSGLDRVSGAAKVKRFLEERRFELGDRVSVVLYDDVASKLDDRFDLPGPIPTTFVLDAAGNVVGREKGAASRARFDELIGAVAK